MADYRNYNADRTEKRCSSCLRMLPLDLYRLRRRKNDTWINSTCKMCEHAGVTRYRTKTKLGVAAEIVRRTKSVSRTEGLAFDLDRDWVLEQLEKQEWRCALTQLSFDWERREGEKRSGFRWASISADRIRHKEGYTRTNVRFVLNVVNLFRNDGSDEQMYLVAEALIANRWRVLV